MKPKKETSVVTAKDVTGAIAAAGAAAGPVLLLPPGNSTGVLAMVAVMATLFPPVIMAMTEASARRLKARGDRFWKALITDWANNTDLTPEEVAGRLEAKVDEPAVTDAVWRAVRGLMDAPNEGAAVVLGVLAAQYGREGRGADAFFRGTVRLLGELSDDELAELSTMLDWVLASTLKQRFLLFARDKEKVSGEWLQIPWCIEIRQHHDAAEEPGPQPPQSASQSAFIRCQTSITDPERLFTLLKTHGLALDSRYNPTFGDIPLNIEIVRATVDRLAALLRVRS